MNVYIKNEEINILVKNVASYEEAYLKVKEALNNNLEYGEVKEC